jgi:hypothetical protein
MPDGRGRELLVDLPEQRGASLLEMMFAIAIVALAMPFAYRQVANIGRSMQMLAFAKQLAAAADPVKNFMRLNASDFAEGEFAEVEYEGEDKRVLILKTGGVLEAFVVSKASNALESNKIAAMIGPDAAAVAQDGAAYSAAGGWAIAIPGTGDGDVVLRVRYARQSDDTAGYLHRTVLSEGELSTMKRDLSMGGFSINNAGAVNARKLNSPDVDSFLAKTPVIAAESVYFAGGLNLNPAGAFIPNIRATGDSIGFRNFYADDFDSGRGSITADRATIKEKLSVGVRFEVKSPSARTVGGFAGASAGSLRCAYLDTENLTFMPGFGLTVSGELLYSATPPIKLGSWSFPNSGGAGPRFSKLVLSNLGGKDVVHAVPDFSEVMEDGWQ